MSEMLSFHNDATIKAKYLQRVEAHRIADEIVQGTESAARSAGSAAWEWEAATLLQLLRECL